MIALEPTCRQCGTVLTAENRVKTYARCNWCKPCDNAYKRTFKEKNAARSRRWVENNREHFRVICREAAKRHYYRHKHEPGRAENNRAKALAWSAANYERFKVILKHSRQRRRARACQAAIDFTESDWLQILEYFNQACAYCLRRGIRLEMDHVVALARGGTHTKDNIVPACKRCNCRKNAQSVFAMVNI